MALNYTKIENGINLVPQNDTTPSIAGDLRYNSVSNQLEYHNGSSVAPIVSGDTPALDGIELLGSTSGSITLTAAPITSTYSLALPDADGTNGQVLTTDGEGGLNWTTVSGVAGANITLSNLSGTTLINSSLKPASDLAITLGDSTHRYTQAHIQDTISSTFTLRASTSGGIALTSPSVASAIYQLPGSDGTAGQVLSTNSFGVLSWVNQTGGSGITQLTGDVTAGPGSGSQSATVTSVGGQSASAIATAVTQASNAANTSLSNLTVPTAINTNLIFDSGLANPAIQTLSSLYFDAASFVFEGSEISIFNNNGNQAGTIQIAGGTVDGLGGILRITAGFIGSPTNSGEIQFSNNTGVVTTLKSDLTANYTFTLPPNGGTSGYVLVTNGSGTTSFADPNGLTYTAASPTDWSGSAPTTVKAALDRIAAALGPIA